MAERSAAIGEGASAVRKFLFFGIKLAITGACFWYLLRQVNSGAMLREASTLEARWFVAAIAIMALQIPLLALRWTWIVNALEPELPAVPARLMLAITMIASFFAQALPNVVSDAIRIWMLSQIRSGWRQGLAGVIIDRGVGVGVLLAIGFVTLLSASTLTTLAGFRQIVLFVFGASLFSGAAGLVFARFYIPILARYRATRWVGEYILQCRKVLIESPAAFSIVAVAFVLHFLTIAGIWSIGEAFSMSLGVVEAAVLFTLMVAIAIVPISLNGWGLRELAVTAFLGAHGIPEQRALLFSICFGMTLVIAALPGAVVLMFYSPAKMRRTAG